MTATAAVRTSPPTPHTNRSLGSPTGSTKLVNELPGLEQFLVENDISINGFSAVA